MAYFIQMTAMANQEGLLLQLRCDPYPYMHGSQIVFEFVRIPQTGKNLVVSHVLMWLSYHMQFSKPKAFSLYVYYNIWTPSLSLQHSPKEKNL